MACQIIPIKDWEHKGQDDWRTHRHSYREWLQPAAPGEGRVLRRVVRDPLEACFDQAEELLAGVEDEDAPPPASEAALRRAQRFVRACASAAQRLGHKIPVPAVSLGPDSSVDVFWRVGAFEILVNFPSAADAPATFYGDDRGVQQVRGTITGDDPLLIPWLIPPR
jgi:hypothetical protein